MLSATAVRAAKPAEKPYKMTDSGGLYLRVTPTAKRWRMDYRFAGKRKTLALGQYPAVSLHDARIRRDEARRSSWRAGWTPERSGARASAVRRIRSRRWRGHG